MKTGYTLAAKALVLLAVAVVAFSGCTPTVERQASEVQSVTSNQAQAPASGGPPPLVVDTSAPLLLDEPVEGQKAVTSEAAAANAACFVCHANYRTEFLVDKHAQAGIGCANCHGESLAHKNDENNTTPPETMYPPERIESFCQGCHTAHDVSPEKVVIRWIERGLDKIEPDKIVCTHCHGDHRMKVRTVIWNKTSGELLRTNKGQ